MDRRSLLKYALGTSFIHALPGLPTAARATICDDLQSSQSRPAAPPPLIDAHCHIFNAQDLSIAGFFEKAVLPRLGDLEQFNDLSKENRDILVGLIFVLIDWFVGRSPSAASELEEIRNKRDLAGKKYIKYVGSTPVLNYWQEDKRTLVALIDALKDNSYKPKSDFRGFKDWYASAELITRLNRELRPGRSPYLPEMTSAQTAYDLYFGNTIYNIYTHWVLLFTRKRYELADILAREVLAEKALLIAPALVDFEHWLGDKPKSPLADQVSVMTELSKRDGDTRLHGYVAYCPLRDALDRLGGQTIGNTNTRRLVEHAIFDGGFVGVKMYPPMGFRAFGNAAFRNTMFPEGAQPLREGRRSSNAIGEELDKVLFDFYGWCEAHNVPILAHAANSNGAEEGYSKRAHPKHWLGVLRNFPRLKINLAHFGDFDAHFDEDRSREEEQWEWSFGRLRRDEGAGLYADLSYASRSMPLDVEPRLLRYLCRFKDAFPGGADHLMFGTDWLMIHHENQFPRLWLTHKYADQIGKVLRDAAYPKQTIDAVMFANAARFLGLTTDGGAEGNRGRLENFYATHRLDRSWLDRLDGHLETTDG